jgi:2-polyprenyl-6-hydroxyphenyl methylase/3-demethylubiquinone-9 3-methyltransferase
LQSRIKYILKNATVFESKNGFHFTDYLDPINDISPEIDASHLTDEVRDYIEKSLQSNEERFNNHICTVERYMNLSGSLCLDVGCGGGQYLSLLKTRGATTLGIEPNDARAHYARTKYGLEVHKLPAESEYWQNRYKNAFDLITLWDVIEHVNFPVQTLQAVGRLLKPGGYFALDTPCKESMYYGLGAFAYKVSGGRCPLFLNAIYQNEPFGHKQIFSTREMKVILEACNFNCVSLVRFHELSFPVEHYLTRLHFPKRAAKILGSVLGCGVSLIRIRNKMLVVAQKTHLMNCTLR